VGTTTTHYVWEGDMVLAEYTAGSSTPASEYVYAGSRMIARDASGTLSYYHKDRLSTRMVTSGSGSVVGTQSHYPFGEDAGTTGTETDKHRFTTYERDSESSLDYAVNRYENAALGRFLSPDPVVDLSGPQRHNRYTYSANDPVNEADPTGLFSVTALSTVVRQGADYFPTFEPEGVDVTYVPDFAHYYYLPFNYDPSPPQPQGLPSPYPGADFGVPPYDRQTIAECDSRLANLFGTRGSYASTLNDFGYHVTGLPRPHFFGVGTSGPNFHLYGTPGDPSSYALFAPPNPTNVSFGYDRDEEGGRGNPYLRLDYESGPYQGLSLSFVHIRPETIPQNFDGGTAPLSNLTNAAGFVYIGQGGDPSGNNNPNNPWYDHTHINVRVGKVTGKGKNRRVTWRRVNPLEVDCLRGFPR
jgi:RHS repeat-associated protein